MAQFIPGTRTVGQAIGQGFEKGFPTGVQDIINSKLKQLALEEQQKGMMGGLKYLYPDASPEEIEGLSRLPQGIHKGAVRGLQASRMGQQSSSRVQGLLQNLQELEQEGGIDKTFGYFGGGKRDTYDVYAKELAKELKNINPALVAPSAKMDKSARDEAIQRIVQSITPQARGSQQLANPLEQVGQRGQQAQQGQGVQPDQEEGYIGQILRNLVSGGVKSAAPLTAFAGRQLAERTGQAALGPAGLIPAGSDVVAGLESLLPEFGKWMAGKLPIPQEAREKIQQKIEKDRPQEGQRLSDYLPTTGNLMKIAGKILPDNIFEPRSENEKDMQDLMVKGANLVGIGGWSPTDAALGSVGGTIAKKVVGKATEGKEWGPLAANTADMVFTSLFPSIYGSSKDYFANIARNGYKKFFEKNSGEVINAENIRKEVERIGGRAAEYTSVPSNKQLLNTMTDISEKFAQNNLTIGQADEAKRALDEVINQVDLTSRGWKELTGLRRNISDTIIDQAKRNKLPDVTDYQNANQIWAGLRKGESLVDALKDQIKKGAFRSITINSLLSKYPAGALTSIGLKTLGAPLRLAGGVGTAAHELIQAYRFLSTTPGAWQDLANGAKDAALGKLVASNARLSSLDKKALSFEEKEERKATKRAAR